MTIIVKQYVGAAGTTRATHVYMTGTIAEVLQEIVDQGFSAKHKEFYTDDKTDARALYCRSE